MGLSAEALAGDSFLKGPYLQSVTTDGVTVMWESGRESTGKIVVKSPTEPDRVVDAPAARLHEVRITGLKSGRRYAYIVESAGERQTGEFATAPGPAEPFSFVVFGDSRSNTDQHRNVVERVRREVPDFIIGTGDMVNEGVNADGWQVFFDTERELLRDNVLYPSLGNHDRQGSRGQASNYRTYFSVPADSPDPERYYAFTYANSRFLVLDSNSNSFSLTDQTSWIERELEKAVSDPSIAHIFVSMHHPPYSVSLHGGQPELREMWTPLYEKYGVDAVFSGHDHCYSRGEKNGVQYFVSGGGGAPLYPRDPRPDPLDLNTVVYFERTLNYLRVHVVGDFVEIDSVRGDGTLIETTSWGTMPTRVARRDVAVTAPVPTPVVVAGPLPASASGSSRGCGVSAPAGRGAGAAGWLALLFGVSWVALRCRTPAPTSSRKS